MEEDRIRIGVKEMLKKKGRERNDLKTDLAECRVLIENKRNSAMVSFISIFHLSTLLCCGYHHWLWVRNGLVVILFDYMLMSFFLTMINNN